MSEMVITKYCASCGNGLIHTAAVCPKCGTFVAGAVGPTVVGGGKSKATAVVLVVFFAYWGWLYTYAANKSKFWISLSIAVLFQLVYLASGTYDALLSGYGAEEATGTVVFGWFVGFGLWLWALLDTTTKPASYFENYRR
jgi:hypothetical protein